MKSFRGLGRCRRSSIVLDGGNIVASRTKAIVTDKIYKENRGWSRAELRDKLQELVASRSTHRDPEGAAGSHRAQ